MAERMKGNTYKLYNHCWSGDVSAMVTHWGFTLDSNMSERSVIFGVKRFLRGEDISVIDLSYNWKNWEFSGGMILPFGKYDQGSRSLSKWNTNEMHTRLGYVCRISL